MKSKKEAVGRISRAAKKKRRILLISILTVAAICCVLCLFGRKKAITELNVSTLALQPNKQGIQHLLADMWAEIEPDIQLNFVERGFSSADYPEGIDVLVYDCENIEYMLDQHFFRELKREDIAAYDALLPFSVQNMTIGGKIFGVPQALCGYFLCFHRGDKPMEEVSNLDDLYHALETLPEAGIPVIEEPHKLWTNFSNGYYPYYSWDSLVDEYGSPTPLSEKMIDEKMPDVYEDMKSLMEHSIGGEKAVLDPVAFGQGKGRAMLCYSEDMSTIGIDTADLDVRLISFADEENIPLLYMDCISICDTVKDRDRYEKCMKLVNLMSSEAYTKNMLFYEGEPNCMLPVRKDVFECLAEEYPIYQKLYRIITDGSFNMYRADHTNVNDLFKLIKSYRTHRDELKDAA